MKAVILAAGEGKRLHPITTSRPKPMIPIAGKPLLEHTILSLKKAGIQQFLFIVGFKENVIRDYFRDGSDKLDVQIEYVNQEEYLGTANAAGLAENFVENDPFILMYGDLLVDPDIFENILKMYNTNDVNGLITLIEVENPQDYGIVALNSEDYVETITEKPSPELNLGNLANAGIYIFDSLIFEAIKNTKKSIRNEYEFTDSMEILINTLNGKIIGYNVGEQYWSDIGLPWQLLEANEFLLSKIKKEIHGKVEKNVSLSGNIFIGENSEIRTGTSIQGPCYIGKNAIIGPNAFIRPYTSIGDNCHVGMSEVKNSLILDKTAIPHFNYVGDSIICEGVNLGAGTKISNLRFDNTNIKMRIKENLIDSGRRKLGAVIGPNSQTGINVSIMCGKKIGENSIIGANTLINEDVPPNTLIYQNQNGETKKLENPF